MHTVKYVVLLVVLLLLAACQPVTRDGAAGQQTGPDQGASSAESSALAGTSWTLASLNGEAVAADPAVTLNLDENGTVSGSDGCNRYSTSYTVEGDSITFGANGVSTMMACVEPVMVQAQAFQAALAAAATFSMDETSLTLNDSSGTPVAAFTVVSSDLTGTSWIVTSYNNGNAAVVGVIEGTTMTADFGSGNTLSGSAGCNNYSTSYQSDGVSQIAIDPPASTMMACADPEGIMDQEMLYLAALTTAATYTREGNRLDLRTADGALAVSFQSAPVAAAEDNTSEAADNTSGMASVTGTVSYLQRSALPPDALVEISIRNASLADAPPEMTTLATYAFTADGQQVPLPFEVFYSTADVNEAALYSIGAAIRDGGGKLLFISTTINPVITRGNPTTGVEIEVSPVQ